MNIYVGNLPYSTTDESMRALFSEFGDVSSVRIITDNMTGQSKGFGFIEMSNDGEADAAIAALNGKEVDGRTIVVSKARPREERPSRGNGGGAGAGSRGGFQKRDRFSSRY